MQQSLSVLQKLRISDGAGSAFDVSLQTMKDRIDFADGEVSPIHLLSAITGGIDAMTVLLQKIRRVDEHAAAAAGGIVNGIAWLGFEDANERVHYLRRSEELARFGASVIGKLLDEILISAA